LHFFTLSVNAKPEKSPGCHIPFFTSRLFHVIVNKNENKMGVFVRFFTSFFICFYTARAQSVSKPVFCRIIGDDSSDLKRGVYVHEKD